MAGKPRTKDEAILEAIFNPEHPIGGIEDEEVDTESGVCDGDGVEGVESEEVRGAKELEVEAVRAAEAGNLVNAVEILTRAIEQAPGYASPYNNRAQVYQLQRQVDLALADLNKAIELSSGRGRVAERAYTQRGIIRKMRGEEEGALDDFKKGARLGNQFAREQVVLMNPYAALCNRMVLQAMAS